MIPLAAALLFASAAAAEPAVVHPPCCALHPAGSGDGEAAGESEQADPAGYTPSAPPEPALSLHGYLDVGFAKAQGNGTSFAPGDLRIPADYLVDTFAPAVNSRGDVASTDPGGAFLNGFLPRSVGIGGKPSFLVNTVDLDVTFQPQHSPLLVFTRLQFLPRLQRSGDETRVVVEQAFGRLIPFDSQELALAVGKFDSVFGIEYLDNQANLRTGITPSLLARYTTGTSIGAKLFWRWQLPSLWSAVSVNVAGTNSGPRAESLQAPDASLTGVPVGSGRLGYELDLPRLQLKLGLSGLEGPRNDQAESDVAQRGWGADARLLWRGLSLAGEFVRLAEDRGASPVKQTGTGTYDFVSGFMVWGWWVQASWTFAVPRESLRRITPYLRYERRHAQFDGFIAIEVARLTVGARVDLWEALALKAEGLFNREILGAPTVANDVFTSSVVYTW